MPFNITVLVFDITGLAIDITGLVIGASAFFTLIYMVIELINHKNLKPINSIVVFLAMFALLTGFNVIAVAIEGDPENLPTYWRGYLGAAGLVGIALPLQKLIAVFKKILSPKPKIGQESPANEE